MRNELPSLCGAGTRRRLRSRGSGVDSYRGTDNLRRACTGNSVHPACRCRFILCIWRSDAPAAIHLRRNNNNRYPIGRPVCRRGRLDRRYECGLALLLDANRSRARLNTTSNSRTQGPSYVRFGARRLHGLCRTDSSRSNAARLCNERADLDQPRRPARTSGGLAKSRTGKMLFPHD